MPTGSIFVYNRTQAVQLPGDTRFPDGVTRVHVRVVGTDRVLSPVDNTWDSFFLDKEGVTDTFMAERTSQSQGEREAF